MVAELAFEPGPPPSPVSSLGQRCEAASASCSEGDPSSVFISSALLTKATLLVPHPLAWFRIPARVSLPPTPTYQGPAAGPRHKRYHHSLVRQVLGRLTGVWEGLPRWGTCLGGKEVCANVWRGLRGAALGGTERLVSAKGRACRPGAGSPTRFSGCPPCQAHAGQSSLWAVLREMALT